LRNLFEMNLWLFQERTLLFIYTTPQRFQVASVARILSRDTTGGGATQPSVFSNSQSRT